MSNKTSDKNVANVTKNDIDILNALIYVYEARLPNYNELMDSEVKSLKNILADYTRQKQLNEEHQKINGELREKVKELEEENSTLKNFTSSIFNNNIEKDFIAKQKIKDKIDELKETLKHYNEYSKLNLLEKVNVDLIDARIDILQELLQEEAKNEL